MQKEKNVHLKKNQPQEKFIFWQLAVNFADFQQNNNVFMKKIEDLKKNQPWRNSCFDN